jgi:hypothetical protein
MESPPFSYGEETDGQACGVPYGSLPRTHIRDQRLSEYVCRVNAIISRKIKANRAATQNVEDRSQVVQEIIIRRDERIGRHTSRAKALEVHGIRERYTTAFLHLLDICRAIRQVRDPFHVPALPTTPLKLFVSTFGRVHRDRTPTKAHWKRHDHRRNARVAGGRLFGHACASRDHLQFVAPSLEVMSARKRREERVAHRLEDGVIGKLERRRQGKVSRVEERVAFRVLSYLRMRSASGDQDIESRRGVIIDVDREI